MISFILFTMGSAVKWIFDRPNTFLNSLSFCFPKHINWQSIFFTCGSCFLTQCKNYLGWLECQKNLVKIMTLINTRSNPNFNNIFTGVCLFFKHNTKLYDICSFCFLLMQQRNLHSSKFNTRLSMLSTLFLGTSKRFLSFYVFV